MKSTVKSVLLTILLVCSALLVIITLLSLLYNTSYWFLQILNFPRLQVLILLLLCAVLCSSFIRHWTTVPVIIYAGVIISICIQGYIIVPYTPFVPDAVEEVEADEVREDATCSILLANVYMKNRTVQPLLESIKKWQPTFVVTMEVNRWWTSQLHVLEADYPHQISFPTDNTYGMTLYSKLPLNNTEIRFLNHDSVPSFYATIRLKNGNQFRLITLHPVAPKSSKHPDNVNQEEVALLLAARIAAQTPMPVVVAGDFNDVGWSHNSHRFAQISGLKDVRYGRGYYGTFNAKSWIMRWPLDYVFVSKDFRVVELERLPFFGSDHFPYYVRLALENPPKHSD